MFTNNALAAVYGITNPPVPPDPTPIPTNGGFFSFSFPSYSTGVTNGSVSISVTRTSSTNIAASVTYFTSDGSAVAGIDYTSTMNTLNFAVNENSTKSFSVPIINTGGLGAPRIFFVNLTAPSNGAFLGLSQAAVSIMQNAAFTVPISISLGNRVTLSGNVTLQGR
jgi:hypothetical protein